MGGGFGWVVEGAEDCKAGFWEGCVWAEGFVYLRGLLVCVMRRGAGLHTGTLAGPETRTTAMAALPGAVERA